MPSLNHPQKHRYKESIQKEASRHVDHLEKLSEWCAAKLGRNGEFIREELAPEIAFLRRAFELE